MKPPPHPRTLRLLATLTLGLIGAAPLKSAVSSAATSGDTPPTSGDVVTLSPFTVESSADRGYLATQTLAGTRLRTNLADTPAALSILTSDFLDDLGATDFSAALPFVPSTESFTLLGADNSGNSAKTGDTLTVRGFKTDTRSRNFFQTLAFNDRYVTDRVTFSRGPNALLFGIGNPGGALHLATNRGELRGRRGDLRYQYDEHGSHRVSFDQNLALIKDRVALRLDVLYDDTKGYRKPAYERKDGAYLTTTINPFSTDGRTQIRLNYEHARQDRVSPRPWAPFDWYSNWVRLGSPLYDNRRAARPANPGAAVPYIRLENTFIDIKGQPVGSIPTFYTARGTGYNSYVRAAGPIVNGVEETSVSLTRDFVSLNPLDLLRQHFGSETALNSWLAELGPLRAIPELWSGGKTVSVPMETFFSGNFDTFKRDFDGAAAFVEQRIGDNLFVEVAANLERAKTDNLTVLRATDYALQYDPNLYLPNGAPNPYAGMPFIGQSAFATLEESTTKTQEYRATATYKLDLTRHRFLRFFDLGRHQLSALWNYYESDRQGGQRRPYLTEWGGRPISEFGPNNAVSGVNTTTTRVLGRYYLLPGRTPYVPEPWLPITGDGTVGRADWIQFSFNRDKNDIDSQAASTQSFFLRDRLVITTGWRRDDMGLRETLPVVRPQAAANPAARQYFGEVDIDATLRNWRTGEGRSWKNRTQGAVLHLVRKWRAVDQFSVFYNQASNVSGAARRYNIFYEEVDPLQGEGIDYGVRFSLFRQSLVGSLTRYETTQTRNFNNSGQLESRGLFQTRLPTILNLVDPAERARRDSFPESWVPIFDSTTKGYELELVWNPTSNLRLRGTFSTHENLVEGFADDMARYLEVNRPRWESYIQANYDPNFRGPAIPNNPTQEERRKMDAETVSLALRDLDAEMPLKQALNGMPTVGVPDWQASLTATYSFSRDSFLKGWTLGGSARQRGEAPLAFESNAAGAVNRGNTLTAPSDTTYDAHVYYGRKLWKNRLGWRVQANVRNLFNNTEPITLSGAWNRDTGEFLRLRNLMREPRTLVLSTTLSW
jgi:hypothetical protein